MSVCLFVSSSVLLLKTTLRFRCASVCVCVCVIDSANTNINIFFEKHLKTISLREVYYVNVRN